MDSARPSAAKPKRRRFRENPSTVQEDSSTSFMEKLAVSSSSLVEEDSSNVHAAASGDAGRTTSGEPPISPVFFSDREDGPPRSLLTGDAVSGTNTAPSPAHPTGGAESGVSAAPPPLQRTGDAEPSIKAAPPPLYPSDGADFGVMAAPPLRPTDDADAGVKTSPAPLRPTDDADAGVKTAPPPPPPVQLTDEAVTDVLTAPAPVNLVGNRSFTQVGGRRNRWDQRPCLNCPSGARERVMTCCGTFLCAGCAVVNPCGCRRWQEGLGVPVPVLPSYVVPDDHRVDSAVLLPRHRWHLFNTLRNPRGNVIYYFFSMEDAFHRRDTGVRYQQHEYELEGRQWTRFIWRLILACPGTRTISVRRFSLPPLTESDAQVLQQVLAEYRRRRQ